jgi:hypothetical protein
MDQMMQGRRKAMSSINLLVVQIIFREPTQDGLEFVIQRCVPRLMARHAGCELWLSGAIRPIVFEGLNDWI